VRVLQYMLDESEFLAPHGIRSVSRVHRDKPYVFDAGGQRFSVDYVPGESTTGIFGGNSNWRGPVWFPINYLLIEALERYDHFYGDTLTVECPTGSGRRMNLSDVARELERRLASAFLTGPDGRRPYDDTAFATDPHFRDLVRFPEYFHGDTGRGLGARFQGWTLLVTRCLEDVARSRESR
jgi:glycogen debranching enzyme